MTQYSQISIFWTTLVKLEAPDGELLSEQSIMTDKKKAKWYVTTGRGDLIEDSDTAFIVRLKPHFMLRLKSHGSQGIFN